jgi:hypothetical protein
MKTNKLLIAFLLLFCNVSLFSQEWVSLDGSKNIQKPSIEIGTSNSRELIFTVKVFGFLSQEVSLNNLIYNELYFPDYQTLKEIGKPALPVITELIGIPPKAEIKIAIIDSTWKQLSGYKVYPYQKPLLETEKSTSFDINKELYSSSLKYPETIYGYSELMNWRGIDNRNLVLCPFKYNPQKQILEVMTDFTVKIEFSSTTKSIESQKSNKLSSRYSRALNNHILNFDSVLIKSYYDATDIQLIEENQETIPVLKSTTITSTDYDYLIIASPTYFNSKPTRALNDWKSRLGFKCKMVSTATTGITASDIKNYITDNSSLNF